MRKFRYYPWVASALALALFFPPGFGTTLAASSPSTSNSTPDPAGGVQPIESFAPPMSNANFSTTAGDALASLFGGCATQSALLGGLQTGIQPPLGQSMGQSGKPSNGSGGLFGNLTQSCGPDISDSDIKAGPSCDDYKTGNTFRFSAIAADQKMAARALGGATCRENKLNAVNGLIQCMDQQSSSIQAQISALQQAYLTNIHNMQGDVMKFKSMESDRKYQSQFVANLLNGDPSTGRPGWNQLATEVKGLIDQMPTVLTGPQGLQQAQYLAQVQRNALSAQEQTITAAEASSCFKNMALTNQCPDINNPNQSGPCQCQVNGPPVSAYQYLTCQYNNWLQVQNGYIQQGSQVSNYAGSQSANLGSALDQLLTLMPNQTTFQLPTSDQQASAMMNQAQAITTDAQADARIASLGLDKPGLPVSQFAKSAMDWCFAQAQNMMQPMMSQPGGTYDQALQKVQSLEADNTRRANELLSTYSDEMRKVQSTLTGVHFPVDPSQCMGASAATQLSCVTDLGNNLKNIYGGTGGNYNQAILVRAPSNVQLQIPFTCNGLTGCQTAAQTVKTRIDEQVSALGTQEQQYVTTANQSIENFTQNLGMQMSPAAQQFDAQRKQLNSLLTSLGLHGLDFSNPNGYGGGNQGQGLSANQNFDGLYDPPTNVFQLLASKTTPPLPDLTSPQAFTQAQQEVGTNLTDEKTKAAKLQSMASALANLENTCRAEDAKLAGHQASDTANQLQTCVEMSQYCTSSDSGDPIQSIAATWNSMLTSMNTGILDPEDVSNISGELSTGSVPKCSDLAARKNNAPTSIVFAGQVPKTSCNSIAGNLKTELSTVQTKLNAAGGAD